ncbi:MAG: hypothetical protein WDN06_07655 [Asticcacaulis sp.]
MAPRRNGVQTLKRIQPLIARTGEATPYDLVEIVQSDAPFIVENRHGRVDRPGRFDPLDVPPRSSPATATRTASARAPAMRVKESMMLVFIERQSADRHKAIMDGIEESLKRSEAGRARLSAHARSCWPGEIEALQRPARQSRRPDRAGGHRGRPGLPALGQREPFRLPRRRAAMPYPRNAEGRYESEAPLNQNQEGFGVPARRKPRRPCAARPNPAVLSAQLLSQLENSEPVTVAKGQYQVARPPSRLHGLHRRQALRCRRQAVG